MLFLFSHWTNHCLQILFRYLKQIQVSKWWEIDDRIWWILMMLFWILLSEKQQQHNNTRFSRRMTVGLMGSAQRAWTVRFQGLFAQTHHALILVGIGHWRLPLFPMMAGRRCFFSGFCIDHFIVDWKPSVFFMISNEMCWNMLKCSSHYFFHGLYFSIYIYFNMFNCPMYFMIYIYIVESILINVELPLGQMPCDIWHSTKVWPGAVRDEPHRS